MIFRSIGRALGSVTRAVSGAVRSVTDFGSNIASIAGGLVKTAKSAIGGGISKILSGGLGGLLKNMPFGGLLKTGLGILGKIAPFAKPLAMLAGGPLGLVIGLASNAGTIANLAKLAQGVLGKLGGSQALPLPAVNNLAQIFAQQQARLMFPRLF